MYHFSCSQRSSCAALHWFCLEWQSVVWKDRQSEWASANSAWQQMKADSEERRELEQHQQPSWGSEGLLSSNIYLSCSTLDPRGPWQTQPWRPPEARRSHQTQRQNKHNSSRRQRSHTQTPHELPYSDDDLSLDETISTFKIILKLIFEPKMWINLQHSLVAC